MNVKKSSISQSKDSSLNECQELKRKKIIEKIALTLIFQYNLCANDNLYFEFLTLLTIFFFKNDNLVNLHSLTDKKTFERPYSKGIAYVPGMAGWVEGMGTGLTLHRRDG